MCPLCQWTLEIFNIDVFIAEVFHQHFSLLAFLPFNKQCFYLISLKEQFTTKSMLKTCNICKYCFKIKISLEILNDDNLLAEALYQRVSQSNLPGIHLPLFIQRKISYS